MHGVRTKGKSKRMPLNKKYKIQRKVREHHRKVRRDKKRNPEKYPKQRKDPGIPNCVPFKAELINELNKNKSLEEERRKILQMELKISRKEAKEKLFDANRDISELMENAANRDKAYEKRKVKEESSKTFTDRSAKTYYKEFKKVVEAADVILEVLDARDPEGSRSFSMEELVKSDPNKRLVLVLNKADLVPRSSLEAWLNYLRKQHPTILFKASTQNQSANLSHSKTKAFKTEQTLQTSKCVGADVLMQLLKNYCRNCGIKTAISVGVVGLPNVGKSSLINSLKRSKACNVGATPGITKTLQEVCLDSKIRLLDCPGVIMAGKDASDTGSSLRNAFRVETLEDPVPAVEAIVKRAGIDQLMLHFKLPEFKDTMEFLALLAKRTGKLLKGGTPNIQAAAVWALRQWNSGRIKFYTYPPTVDSCDVSSVVLVSELSDEFSLNDLSQSEAKLLDSLPVYRPSEVVRLGPAEPMACISEDLEGKEEPMEAEHVEEVGSLQEASYLPARIEIEINSEPAVNKVPEKKKERWETDRSTKNLSSIPMKKIQKLAAKKIRKEKGRNERMTTELTQAFQSLEGLQGGKDSMEGAYDFKEYFLTK